MRVVTGAPYSGRMSSESVQTLADGTHLKNPGMPESATYRDGQGRMRTERELFGAPGGNQKIRFTLIEIQDPVARCRYLIDSVNRVAHRTAFNPGPSAPVALAPSFGKPSSSTLPDGTTVTIEPLGNQVLSGVTVVGTRDTSVHPAGSRLGNDRPVTTINELWMSPQLGVIVSSTNLSPSGNKMTMMLKDVSVAEPDPSLFQVPAGYQIVDETGPFTIHITATN